MSSNSSAETDAKDQKMKEECAENTRSLWFLYATSVCCWLIFCIWYNATFDVGIVASIILGLPVLLSVISFLSVEQLCERSESAILETNFLALGSLIAFWLLYGKRQNLPQEVYAIFMFSVGLTVLSLMDVWVPRQFVRFLKHLRGVLRNYSATTLLLTLWLIYELVLSTDNDTQSEKRCVKEETKNANFNVENSYVNEIPQSNGVKLPRGIVSAGFLTAASNNDTETVSDDN